MRAEYDHRVTLPIKFVPVDLKSFFSGKRNWAITFQYYRRTAPHYRNKPNEREWIHVGRGTVLPARIRLHTKDNGKTGEEQYACTLCRTEWGRVARPSSLTHMWMLENAGSRGGCFCACVLAAAQKVAMPSPASGRISHSALPVKECYADPLPRVHPWHTALKAAVPQVSPATHPSTAECLRRGLQEDQALFGCFPSRTRIGFWPGSLCGAASRKEPVPSNFWELLLGP